MYSELLAGLCADVDPLPLPVSTDELVVILLQCRRRMNGNGGDGEHIMAEDLALELDHDRMLLRLCTAMGIETEPSGSGIPWSSGSGWRAVSAKSAWTSGRSTTTAGSASPRSGLPGFRGAQFLGLNALRSARTAA